MKRPNGTGTIIKMPGNRRKPFAVYVTEQIEILDGVYRQKRKYLGYFEKRIDAEKLLMNYSYGLIDPKKTGMTFEDVFEAWKKNHFQTIGEHTKETYLTGFNGWKAIHNLRFDALRHSDLQDVLDTTDRAYSSKSKMRTLVHMLYQYAVINDITVKDYSVGLNVGKNDTVRKRIPFTEKEIEKLWKNLYTVDNVDLVLIQIYTGMRASEMLDVRSGDVNLMERWIKGGAKTEAGKGRLIPIHKLIQPLIEKRIDGDRMIGVNYTYHNYRYRFNKVMEELNMNHQTHDCRATFSTRIARTEADKLTVKRILGHADSNITDKVYTKKDIEDLLKAIDAQPF